jgi:hypothetical protein
VALRKPDLEFWFCWIPQQQGQTQAGWKLHDIRLPEVDTDLNWFTSITEATMQFKGADGLVSHTTIFFEQFKADMHY